MFDRVLDASAADVLDEGPFGSDHAHDRKQAFCRQMLTEYSEDDLLYLEVEINAFLNEGTMTRRLMRLLGAVEKTN